MLEILVFTHAKKSIWLQIFTKGFINYLESKWIYIFCGENKKPFQTHF